jgi:hypothetical protein
LPVTIKHKVPRVGSRAEESARFAPTSRDDDAFDPGKFTVTSSALICGKAHFDQGGGIERYVHLFAQPRCKIFLTFSLHIGLR